MQSCFVVWLITNFIHRPCTISGLSNYCSLCIQFHPPLLYRSSCKDNKVPLSTCFCIHWQLGNISVGTTWLLQNLWDSVRPCGTIWDSVTPSRTVWDSVGQFGTMGAQGALDGAWGVRQDRCGNATAPANVPATLLQCSLNRCPSYCALPLILCSRCVLVQYSLNKSLRRISLPETLRLRLPAISFPDLMKRQSSDNRRYTQWGHKGEIWDANNIQNDPLRLGRQCSFDEIDNSGLWSRECTCRR